jgi:hypothetical protein
MNVRNVKSFFSIKRAKFGTEIPIAAPRQTERPATH